MRAYKFRSAAQIGLVFDILINRRLYCADWKNLNDPMEGMFVFSRKEGQESFAEQAVTGIIESKRRYKICSLAGTFDCHLLWAHYASGFDGVAIEVELPDNAVDIKKVSYRGVFAFLDMDNFINEDEAAKKILFSKYNEWKYEQEIRILSETEYYQLEQPIKRVIAGHRMPQALFDVLHMTCNRLGIEFCKVGIGDEGIDADRVPPYVPPPMGNQSMIDYLATTPPQSPRPKRGKTRQDTSASRPKKVKGRKAHTGQGQATKTV